MNVKLVKIGDNSYINPYYIVRVVYQRTFGESNLWYVKLRDGVECRVEDDYVEDLIRKLS